MEHLLFQKNIELEYPMHELISVNVKDNLNYVLDHEGKRAVGTLNIEGDYIYNQHKYHFEDLIEIDILAPFNRLNDNEEFCIEIEDYDYHMTSGKLSLEIHVNAYGVLKKEDRHILIDEEQERYEEIKELMAKQELIEVMESTLEEKRNILDVQGDRDDDFIIEQAVQDYDLIEDNFVVYPFYIVKNEDTYATIASAYEIDELKLRKINEDKEIKPSCIIRLC